MTKQERINAIKCEIKSAQDWIKEKEILIEQTQREIENLRISINAMKYELKAVKK